MEKDFDFNAIGKRTPYRMPEGFLERMKEETLMRVAEQKRKQMRYRLKWGVSVALAVAAMVCGVIFFPSSPAQMPEQPVANEWLAQMAKGADEVDIYLQGLTDEELEAWVEFSENDIYYELTTGNENED